MSDPTGFHGNLTMLAIVDTIVQTRSVYIETGTNIGHTFCYMARTYPQLDCYGCEPVDPYFTRVRERTQPLKNAKVFNHTSQRFMRILDKNHSDIFEHPYLAWIDAHSKNFAWPLSEEMQFFTNRSKDAYLLIDDFFVPNQPQFRSNKYGNQRYTLEYISQFFNKEAKLNVYFPTYQKEKHDPTLTGWVMLTTDPRHATVLKKYKDVLTRVS